MFSLPQLFLINRIRFCAFRAFDHLAHAFLNPTFPMVHVREPCISNINLSSLSAIDPDPYMTLFSKVFLPEDWSLYRKLPSLW